VRQGCEQREKDMRWCELDWSWVAPTKRWGSLLISNRFISKKYHEVLKVILINLISYLWVLSNWVGYWQLIMYVQSL